ncbi:MAG TPA: hypothetical protein VE866_05535 [Candidatus Binatia bacterium]|jgi:hypothetical protein|nr:hypothetical protein [Candidatus Binatia bacterium]
MDKHRIEAQARELLGEVIKHESTIFNDSSLADRFRVSVPVAYRLEDVGLIRGWP